MSCKKIVVNIIGDKYSKDSEYPITEINIDEIDVLPHKCKRCGSNVNMENRLYFKGDYFHRNCFLGRRKK